MTLSTSKAALAGLALLATSAAFNAQAEAPHPLLSNPETHIHYGNNLIDAVAAAGVPSAEGIGRGIVATLEDTLRGSGADRTKGVLYQSKSGYNAVIQALADPKAPVYVCVEKDNEIWGSWKILNNAQVVVDETPSRVVNGYSPCESWVMATAWNNPAAQVTMPQK